MKTDQGPKTGGVERGARIRALRAKRGLVLFDLAAQSGLDLTTVYRAERTGKVTERTAKLLAPVLGVTPKDLLK